jgi:YVTN family beta-propeller protein
VTGVRTLAAVASLVAAGLLAATPAQAAGTSSGPRVVARVPVFEAGPLAVDPLLDSVYAGNLETGKLAVIDGRTNSKTAAVHEAGCCGQTAVATNPLTHRVYVTGIDDPDLIVIDGLTRRVVSRVNLDRGGLGPGALAVNPVTNTVYVANAYDGSVAVIDGRTNEVTATLRVGAAGGWIAADPVRNRVYLTNDGVLTVLDGRTNRTLASVQVPGGAADVVVDPVADRVYVSNVTRNTVTAIDGGTDTIKTVAHVGAEAILAPFQLAVNPVTGTVYVSTYTAVVSLVSGATGKVSGAVRLPVPSADLAVDPLTGRAYVSDQRAAVFVISG